MNSRYKGFPRSGERGNPFSLYPELCTEIVFLIGNGKSRENFDLERLRKHGTIVGCNALYRDFNPDILVAIDQKMIAEITKAEYWKENICVVPNNRSAGIPNSLLYKGDQYNTSGCFAMQMIAFGMKAKYCVMLGMDAYPGNVYDQTVNYAVNTLQNFSGVLNYYEKTLTRSDLETKMINVNFKDTWSEHNNVGNNYYFVHYDEFEKWLQNKYYNIRQLLKD